MSQYEAQMWALLVGFLIVGSLVFVLYRRRQALERAGLAEPPTSEFDRLPPRNGDQPSHAGPSETATSATPQPSPSAPTRHASPPDSSEETEALGMGVRSLVTRVVAERAPKGWSALILCPPAHPARMTWHVHLAPQIALDVADGRSVPVRAPTPSHAWELAGGRTVQVGDGDSDPPPSDETQNVRVTGPYLTVVVTREENQPPRLVARVMGVGHDELPQPHALANDVRAVQGALRSAIESAVGAKMLGMEPAVGYRPASWAAHERVWLTVGR